MQIHRLHHNAVMVIGQVVHRQAALATSAERSMYKRPFNCMHDASAVSCGSVHFFQQLDVCVLNRLKSTPALDNFVHAQI